VLNAVLLSSTNKGNRKFHSGIKQNDRTRQLERQTEQTNK